MSNNPMGQAPNMPSIGSFNQGQGGMQFTNNPLASPHSSLQAPASQHSPMGAQSQVKASTSGGGDTVTQLSQIVSRPRLQELVREVDPTVQLDEEVEEVLLQLADDFIETTLNAACALAKHRHAPTVELKDVQLHLVHHGWLG